MLVNLYNDVLTSAYLRTTLIHLLASALLKGRKWLPLGSLTGPCLCTVPQDDKWPWLPPWRHSPERTHLSRGHADEILADAVDAEGLGAALAVIVLGGTLGAMCLRWAEAPGGYTRAQCQGSRQSGRLSLASIKEIPVASQWCSQGIISQQTRYTSWSLERKLLRFKHCI